MLLQVPVKNNDHAVGGDCGPHCAYDATFSAYGAMFVALRTRRWVLTGHGARVTTAARGASTPNALANAFTVTGAAIAPPAAPETTAPHASSAAYLAVVTFAPRVGSVGLTLHGVGAPLPCVTVCAQSDSDDDACAGTAY